ncbi:MAG: hypothetical protein HY267_00630, partial [Deltaproteobacteria bacterium]|nr:hypothetical protein [Deltaproteobacteria bacterium]
MWLCLGLLPLSVALAPTVATPQTAAALLFGPEDFVRLPDRPHVEKRTFSVANPSALATLCIANGGQDEQYTRVSSAEITLNHTVVVAADAFKP